MYVCDMQDSSHWTVRLEKYRMQEGHVIHDQNIVFPTHDIILCGDHVYIMIYRHMHTYPRPVSATHHQIT